MTRMLQRVLFLLAVGLTLTASGQGTIVHYDPADIPVFGSDPYTYNFDLNGDGVTDFQFQATGRGFSVIPLAQNAALAVPEPPGELGAKSSVVSAGEIIQSLAPIPSAWVQGAEGFFGRYGPTFIDCTTEGCVGYWQGASRDAYLGTQFYIGSELHYGWVHLLVFNNGGYLKEWAYDTVAGQGILAGAVPEPSTWALLVLGLGSLFFCSRRNRPCA